MVLKMEKFLDWLEIEDPRIRHTKEEIIQALGNAPAMRKILVQQFNQQQLGNCYACDDHGDCFILNGIACFDLGDPKTAIKNLETANLHLRSKDKTWNHIVGLVLLGMSHEKDNNPYQAYSEYEKALQILEKNYLRVHKNDYIPKAKSLFDALKDTLKQVISQQPADIKQNREDPSADNGSYLALFSIPIYGTVEAGLDGKLHVDHFNTFTIINQVELKKQMFDVYNMHGTASLDRQITITTKRDHGWLRVHGLSMNGWDLPFDENDYVLFYKASTASHFDFVIASNSDPSGEIALMVKRFDAENNQLISRSKDTSNPYHPIPVDEGHQIVGVVIAVAKSAK